MTLPNGEPLRWNTPGAKWNGTVEEVLAAIQPNKPMQQDEIDITITSEAEALVHTKAAELRDAILAFGVTLTDEQQARLFKLGDARMAFHDKSRDHLHQHDELVPPTVDVPKYDKDEAALQAVKRMKATVAGATASLDDTAVLLGSDLISADVAFYNYLPLAIKAKTPGAQAVYEDLRASWPGRGPGPKNPPASNP